MKSVSASGGPGVAALVAVIVCAACASPAVDPAEDLVVQVLPFEVLGQDEGANYVGRAFAESLTVALTGAPDLQVLSVPAGSATATPEGEGTATRTLSGRLTRAGDAVLATLQLREAAGGGLLWGSELASDQGDLSELAFRLALRAIQELGHSYPDLYDYIVNVTGGPRMSASPQAARAWESWRTNDIQGFVQTSSELVAEYGDDPAAHVLHAWALTQAWDADPASETLASLKERLVTLDRVDPASPYDELLLGYVYRSSGEPGRARVLYTRVLDRKDLTSTARSWALRQRSFTFLQVGNAAAARDDAAKALELDSSSARSLIALSKALEAMDLLDESILASSRALMLEPSRWRHHQRRGIVAARANRFDEALRSLRQACDLSDNQEACANLAVTLQRAGRKDLAREAATHAESLVGNRWGFYNLACYRALAGERTLALAALDRAVELDFADVLINTDPDLESLRPDSEFQALVRQVHERLSSRRQQSVTVFPWQA